MKTLFTVSEDTIRGNFLLFSRRVGNVNGFTMLRGCINRQWKRSRPFSGSWQMQEVSRGEVLRSKKKAANDVVDKDAQCSVTCNAIWQEVCQIFLCLKFRRSSNKTAFSGGERTLGVKRLLIMQENEFYNKAEVKKESPCTACFVAQYKAILC